jgi:hypothetical protein
VIIKNWERIFNLNHKQFDGAVLNVRPKENSKINAELIEIDYNDLAQFFIREFSYDFAEIPLTEIDMSLSPSDKAFTAEFAYMCVSRYDDRKEPLAHYLKTCMYSCKNVSVQALDMFVDSSIVYHLDQEMTVRDYLFKIYGDKGIELFSTNDGGY